MTWSARFKVAEVDVRESGVSEVHAVASVEDGTLTQNTERATRLELFARIEGETSLAVGDEITGSGHFTG
jgi:hypothetical protein